MADDAGPDRELSESTTNQTDSAPALPADAEDAEGVGQAGQGQETAPVGRPIRGELPALVAGLIVVLALAGLVGWLGVRDYQWHLVDAQRNLFLQTARQGVVDLTTIDYQHAETDVQRVLDSAIGTFYDSFSRRSQPLVDVVKRTQSRSVGTVSVAGLESAADDEAQVLVAASVKTSSVAAPEQPERFVRMRVTVRKLGDEVKISQMTVVP